ncbi:hypothetical protein TNCV_2839341 [Trichonephila clavipes]|nr:hypothetical protein TNCV_2839341 [Trichonephila clavipes]
MKRLCPQDRRNLRTAIISELSGASASVNSRIARIRLANVRQRGRIPRKRLLSQFAASQKRLYRAKEHLIGQRISRHVIWSDETNISLF